MRLIYFSYFHSVLSYRIIFWYNSIHSKYIFKIQKRTIRIVTNARIRDSCRDFLKKFQILHFFSQYVHSLLMFVVKNRSLFKLNSDIHGFSTRYDNDFHLSSANLKLFQKGILTCQRLIFRFTGATREKLSEMSRVHLRHRSLWQRVTYITRWPALLATHIRVPFGKSCERRQEYG
jgi:hypothetical protein